MQSILGHSLSLISILVAYSTVVGAAWATRPDTVPHALVPVVPIPVWLVVAWHSQLNSRVYAHNQAIVLLEQKLLDHIPSITYPTRLWLGHTSGRMVNEIPILLKEKRYAIAAASIITYGGLLAIVLALTIASVSCRSSSTTTGNSSPARCRLCTRPYSSYSPLLTSRRSGSTSTRWTSGRNRPTRRFPHYSGLSTVIANEAEQPRVSSTRQVPL